MDKVRDEIDRAGVMADSGKHNIAQIAKETGLSRKQLTRVGVNKDRVYKGRVSYIKTLKAMGLTGKVIAVKVGLKTEAVYQIIAKMEITRGG
jgi:hypothetical protein